MVSANYTLRVATPEDAPALSALATRTFTATFGHLFTDADLSPFITSTYNVDRLRREIEDPQRYVVLLFSSEDSVTPCGYGMLHEGNVRPGDKDSGSPEDYLELKRLYVDDDHHGKGAAQMLMGHLMEVVKQKKHKIVWLGAWYKGFRAHSFYKKYGFVPTGTNVFIVGTTENPHIVFTLQQADALP